MLEYLPSGSPGVAGAPAGSGAFCLDRLAFLLDPDSPDSQFDYIVVFVFCFLTLPSTPIAVYVFFTALTHNFD